MQRNGKVQCAGPSTGGEEPCHCKARATLDPMQGLENGSWVPLCEIHQRFFHLLHVTRAYPMSLVVQSHP